MGSSREGGSFSMKRIAEGTRNWARKWKTPSSSSSLFRKSSTSSTVTASLNVEIHHIFLTLSFLWRSSSESGNCSQSGKPLTASKTLKFFALLKSRAVSLKIRGQYRRWKEKASTNFSSGKKLPGKMEVSVGPKWLSGSSKNKPNSAEPRRLPSSGLSKYKPESAEPRRLPSKDLSKHKVQSAEPKRLLAVEQSKLLLHTFMSELTALLWPNWMIAPILQNQLPGMLRSLWLLSHCASKREGGAMKAVQAVAVVSSLVVLGQMMPSLAFVVVALVVGVGLVLKFLNHNKLSPFIWRLWGEAVSTGGVQTLAKDLWGTFEPYIPHSRLTPGGIFGSLGLSVLPLCTYVIVRCAGVKGCTWTDMSIALPWGDQWKHFL